ncbi:MAG: hypothetical protein JNK90_25910 [Planctomycetaceae bacterium]|nr:hypothetical protein [Planctomycetaceae bacterium]MBN8604244.1 hypothetical protein [Planctomycetota bacterium]
MKLFFGRIPSQTSFAEESQEVRSIKTAIGASISLCNTKWDLDQHVR